MLMHEPHSLAHRRRRRGFALIEALAAMVIVGFGMLALVRVQSTLTQSADAARQRSEATRLAEEKIEQMRAYNSVVSGVGVSWADMTSSSAAETPSSPSDTTYSRSWTLSGAATDPMRPIQVSVKWQDRTGTQSAVTLNSIIARVDPALAGALSFPLPGNGNIKLPKSRNLNIPIQAVNLGGGQSAYNLGSGSNTFAVVFSNVTGYVVMRCTSAVNSASDLGSCTNYNAYILAGYISKLASNGSVDTSSWLQTSSNFSGINLSQVTPYLSHGGTDCSVGPAVNQNSSNGATIPGYDYYLCVMQVSASGATWAGKVQLAGVPTGYVVCRYQYSSTTSNSNENNVQPYSGVNESLDQQNYAIAQGNNANSCPSGTVLHQTCTSANPCPSQPD